MGKQCRTKKIKKIHKKIWKYQKKAVSLRKISVIFDNYLNLIVIKISTRE